MRVTENLMTHSFLFRTQQTLEQIRRAQEQLASGKKLLRPSDDPRALAKSLGLSSDLRRLEAFSDNASSAIAFMSLTESTLNEIQSTLSRAKELLVEGMNAPSEGTGAESQALELRSLVEGLLLISNRDIGGRTLFGGLQTTRPAYAQVGGRIVYQGDGEDILEELGPGLRVAINLTGRDVFQTLPSRIRGGVDLDPAVSRITSLDDLLQGRGVHTGHIEITDSNGVTADVDLLAAQNVGDVIDAINDAGTAVTAAIAPDRQSIVLTDSGGGTSFSVADTQGGTLAQDLGILGDSTTGTIQSLDLDPALTENTALALLLDGAGLGPATWTLRNDGEGDERSAVIDPTQANTVGDLLRLIDEAVTPSGVNLGLRASIDGAALTVVSTRLHTTISISDDAGSSSAAALGLDAVGEPRDLFELVEEAARAVESRDTDAMDAMIRDVTEAIEKTAGMWGAYGARMRQVLSLSEYLQDQKVDLTIRLSDVEDADLAEAALLLSKSEIVYNASLSAGGRMLQLNLFNFIR